MALTPGRAVALALIACAGAATLLLPPQPRRLERSVTYVRGAANQARRELNDVRQAVSVRILRDSVRTLVRAGKAPVTTVFVGRWTASERSWLGDRLAQIRDSADGGSPIGLAFVRDSLFRGVPALLYAIPDTGNDACIAIYAEGNIAPGPWMSPPPVRRLAAAMLGPCAYYLRFGPAGPAVRRWLRRGGAGLALTSPTFPPPAWRPPTSRSWLASLMEQGGSIWFADPRLASPLALNACLAGDLAACREFVGADRVRDRALARLGVHQEVRWRLGTDEAVYLSDLLVGFGPERFARFWHGDGSLEEAFASAFDESLGVWTQAWARDRFGNGPDRTPVATGALGASLGTVAVCLALAALVAHRRRVAP